MLKSLTPNTAHPEPSLPSAVAMDLPTDVWENILARLNPYDLAEAARVSTPFRKLSCAVAQQLQTRLQVDIQRNKPAVFNLSAIPEQQVDEKFIFGIKDHDSGPAASLRLRPGSCLVPGPYEYELKTRETRLWFGPAHCRILRSFANRDALLFTDVQIYWLRRRPEMVDVVGFWQGDFLAPHFAFSPDGQALATVTKNQDYWLQINYFQNIPLEMRLPKPLQGRQAIVGLTWLPGDYLAVVGKDCVCICHALMDAGIVLSTVTARAGGQG